MASRAKRLQVVLTLAHSAEQAAAQSLQLFREKIDREQQQLHQLEEYAAQYLQAYSERRFNVRASELISYSQFTARLDDLKKEQASKIFQLEQQAEPYFLAWQHAHQKHKKLEEFIQELIVDEQKQADKAMQKVLDEFATQRFTQAQTATDQ